MKNRTLKLEFKKIIKKNIRLFYILLFGFGFNSMQGQTYSEYSNGMYQFTSYYPEWDLHFWLFDDGHHSFEHSPIHEYGTYSLPSKPILYHSEPYDDPHVDEEPLGTINNGNPDPIPVNMDFQNQIEIKQSWNLVNSEENFFILQFENNQFDHPISGCVEFHFNIGHTSINESDILDDYGNDWVDMEGLDVSEYEGYTHKFVWLYHGLKEDEQRFVYIPARCLAPSMEFVYARGVLKINECNVFYEEDAKNDGAIEGIIHSPIYTLRSVVSNYPHDPNFINSDPLCYEGDAGVLSQTFRYRLYFQNEGVDPSLNVITNFYSSLPLGSVLLVDSSFPSYLTWDIHGIYAGFNHINLRGLNEEEPRPPYEHTIGWIEIDVCYNLEDYGGDWPDCIFFEGHVFFDGQPPIVAENMVCYDSHCNNPNMLSGTCQLTPRSQGVIYGGDGYKITSVEEDVNNTFLHFDLIPNPAISEIQILGINLKENSKVLIINVLGEIIINHEKTSLQQGKIDVSELKSGTYFVKIINEGNVSSRSFIKI